jgi:hypothetical protein
MIKGNVNKLPDQKFPSVLITIHGRMLDYWNEIKMLYFWEKIYFGIFTGEWSRQKDM